MLGFSGSSSSPSPASEPFGQGGLSPRFFIEAAKEGPDFGSDMRFVRLTGRQVFGFQLCAGARRFGLQINDGTADARELLDVLSDIARHLIALAFRRQLAVLRRLLGLGSSVLLNFERRRIGQHRPFPRRR